MLFAAAAPVGALVLGALGVMAEEAQSGLRWVSESPHWLRKAFVTHASSGLALTATLLAVAVNVALGLVIVALEVLLAH